MPTCRGCALPDIAEPHLRKLADETGESSSVAVLDGADIVYVARVAVYRIMWAAIGVGTRFPAYATAMGRAILAFGPPERRRPTCRASPLEHTHALHDHRPGGPARGAGARARDRAGRSSTRSSRRACVRSPRRCGTRPVKWSLQSTSQRRLDEAGQGSRTSSVRCWRPPTPSSRTSGAPGPASAERAQVRAGRRGAPRPSSTCLSTRRSAPTINCAMRKAASRAIDATQAPESS